MVRTPEIETLEVRKSDDWHAWLLNHHGRSEGVWLVFHRRGPGVPSITYDEALDGALAYGWIDSLIKRINGEKYARKFTPRRPWSIWSKRNIDRVGRLLREGKMTRWGLEAFEKRTNEISMLKKINADGTVVPNDFETALKRNKRAWGIFQRMAPSHRKRYLIWISGAKKPETKQRRVDEAVLLVAQDAKNLLK